MKAVQSYLSLEEYDAVLNMAKQQGRSVSNYLKHLLNEQIRNNQ